MNKAVFFDRDGVLLKLVLHDGKFTAPWKVNEVELCHNIVNIKELIGYKLFIISNQPDMIKGNTTFSDLMEIHAKFDQLLKNNNIYIDKYYYCYHIKENNCQCRKPSPYYINQAKKEFDLDLSKSYMIGDQDTDIECGKSAGCKTIKISKDLNISNALKRLYE